MTRIGDYKVTDLGNGRYACSLTNGNIGAFVTDEAGLLKLREKYSPKEDTIEISSKEENKPNMSFSEALMCQSFLLNPFCGWLGYLKPDRVTEVQDAMRYYVKHPDEIKNNAQAAS